MRNEDDQAFADIVKKEFDEQWVPPASPPKAEPAQPARPDFHLNLYDDEESYRELGRATWTLSKASWWSLGLVAAGLLIAIARVLPWGLPGWLGWIAIGCFVAGVGISLWHLTHRRARRDEDDDQGQV